MSCFLKLHNTQTCWFVLSLSSKLFYAFEAFRREISNTDYCKPSLVFKRKKSFNLQIIESLLLVVLQLLSRIRLFATPWTAARQASLYFTIFLSLLKLMSSETVMPSTITSSVAPFSSCPQSLTASGSFPMSQLFPGSPALQADSLPSEPPNWFYLYNSIIFSKLSGLCNRHQVWSSIRASEV